MIMELLGLGLFLLVGICGCVYPFLKERDEPFNKSADLYRDGDNT